MTEDLVLFPFNMRPNWLRIWSFMLMTRGDNRLFKILLTLDLSSPYNGNAEFSIDRRDGALSVTCLYSRDIVIGMRALPALIKS
jgi:hypothetical protein